MRTWQDALWAIPNYCGHWWDVVVGVVAIVVAVVLYLKLILNHPFDALLVTRALGGLGLLCAFANIFNSGWLKIALGLMVLGYAGSILLIVTEWCSRADRSLTIPRALWNFFTRSLSRLLSGGRHMQKDIAHE